MKKTALKSLIAAVAVLGMAAIVTPVTAQEKPKPGSGPAKPAPKALPNRPAKPDEDQGKYDARVKDEDAKAKAAEDAKKKPVKPKP